MGGGSNMKRTGSVPDFLGKIFCKSSPNPIVPYVATLISRAYTAWTQEGMALIYCTHCTLEICQRVIKSNLIVRLLTRWSAQGQFFSEHNTVLDNTRVQFAICVHSARTPAQQQQFFVDVSMVLVSSSTNEKKMISQYSLPYNLEYTLTKGSLQIQALGQSHATARRKKSDSP